MSLQTPQSHLTHDELSPVGVLAADCREVGSNLHLDERRLARAARQATQPPPSIHFADFPSEVPKREIRISDATARLAGALHLHLD